ncbi:MAG: hypothetical protein GYA52_06875 [Chloroflexi bacterium]|nr:hypothetical protein [Chloroflexota bacterium]
MIIKKRYPLLFILAILLASCQQNTSITPTRQVVNEQGTPHPSEPRKLTICVGYMPDSLYIYKANSQVDWNILQAIYDGPFDHIDGDYEAVILQNIPSPENGGVQVTTISIDAGESILDATGNPTTLQAGTTYLPAGCNSADCAKRWDGNEPVELEQVSITFRMLEGLLWSDGTPLTASDSLFSYTLAADPATPVEKTIPDQIGDYLADGSTVTVTLLPGRVPPSSMPYFFTPLPSHLWSDYTASEILTAPFANQTPLGWGAYRIKEWDSNSILLEKNPYYFRAAEGLPYFDELEFRFISKQGDTNLASLKFDYSPFEIFEYNWSPDGETVYSDQCDYVDSSVDLSDQYDMLDYLLHYYMNPAIQVYKESNRVLNGIWINPLDQTDQALKSAISMCIDRAYLNSKVNYSALFQTHRISQSREDVNTEGYSLETATSILDEMGWSDDDQDPQTARVARGVTGVSDGTALVLNMDVLNSDFNIYEAQIIQQSLRDCGMQVNIRSHDAAPYYAPEGPILTMDFDLMLFNHQISPDFPCDILDEQRNSIAFPGMEHIHNVTAACQNNEISPVELEEELPLIPLYYQATISLARVDMCGVSSGNSSGIDLHNLEEFNYGERCLH